MKRNSKILSKIINKKLVASGFSGLQWFAFGKEIVIEDYKGNERKVSEFYLNVSTGWRIKDSQKIITGSQDYFHPPGSIDEDFDYESFNPHEDENRVEKTLEKLFNELELKVTEVSSDIYGSININFQKGYCLEVLPMDSVEQEHWRFIDHTSNDEHLVFTGSKTKL